MTSKVRDQSSGMIHSEAGFTLAGALVILAVLAVFMTLAVPLWSRIKQRDDEQELVFRGKEYVKAIGRYHLKFGAFPPDLETLVKLKMVRKMYKDPMTKSGKWKLLHPESLVQTGPAAVTGGGKDTTQAHTNKGGKDDVDDEGGSDQKQEVTPGLQDEKDKSDEEPELTTTGPVVGVASRSKKTSIMIYDGHTHYNQWTFVYALQQQPGQQPPKGQPPQGQPPQGQPPQGKPPQQQPPQGQNPGNQGSNNQFN